MQNQKARRPSKKKKLVTAKTKAIQQNARQRARLAPHVGKILDIVADYICIGKKTITVTSGIMENTILLKNIRTPHGQSICDHIWVRFSDVKNLASHIRQLSSGATVKLSAIPYCYTRERHKRIVDPKYGLSDITIDSVSSAPAVPIASVA